jgi:hypothetical protein
MFLTISSQLKQYGAISILGKWHLGGRLGLWFMPSDEGMHS